MTTRPLISLAAAIALCAGACSFNPDYAGSKLDCAGGRPCPAGWYCPADGEKICVEGSPGADSGVVDGGKSDTCGDAGAEDCAGGHSDGGGSTDGGKKDGGGACTDTCLADKQLECVTGSSYHLCGYTDDGCLGWGAEQYCTGTCEDSNCTGCTVDCAGKDCGDDGCSGSCGACTRPPAATCKDNRTLSTYAADGTCGGDGACAYAPAEMECPYGCFNGSCATCTPVCAGKECGDDGCGVDCAQCDQPPASRCLDGTTLRYHDKAGSCASNKCTYATRDLVCPSGCDAATASCKNCQKDCNGKQCGSDGCGGDCGSCGAYASCNAQGQCECADAAHLNCAGGWTDGCEVNRLSDPYNCGNCGNQCSLPNAQVASCAAAACKVAQCAPGYDNCNGVDIDGCETSLTTDNDNCAQCKKKCPQHAHCTAAGCACDVAATACGLSCCAAGEQCCNGACTPPLWVYRETGATGWGSTLVTPGDQVYVAGSKNGNAYVARIDDCGQRAASVEVDNGSPYDTATAVAYGGTNIFSGTWLYAAGITTGAGKGQEGLGIRIADNGPSLAAAWQTPYWGSDRDDDLWGLAIDASQRLWLYGTSDASTDGNWTSGDWLVVATGYSGAAMGYRPVSNKIGVLGVGRNVHIVGQTAHLCGALQNASAYVATVGVASCDSTPVDTCLADAVLEVNDSAYQTEFRDVVPIASGGWYASGFRVLAADLSQSQGVVWQLDAAGAVVNTFAAPHSGAQDILQTLAVDGAGGVYACGIEGYTGGGKNTGDAVCYKLNTSLQKVWKFTHATAATDLFAGVNIAQSGMIYVSGSAGDALIVKKCDSNGNCGN